VKVRPTNNTKAANEAVSRWGSQADTSKNCVFGVIEAGESAGGGDVPVQRSRGSVDLRFAGLAV
jgi:hypothetical protein